MPRKRKINKLGPVTIMLQKEDIITLDQIAARYGVRRGILLRSIVLDRIDKCKKEFDISFLKE